MYDEEKSNNYLQILTNFITSRFIELYIVLSILGWLVLHNFIPQPLRLYMTCLFINIIFIISLHRLIKHGRIMIWINLCQPILFTMLYMQIYSHYGSHHYTFPTPNYIPSLMDWFEFTFVHILRASDILDIIEEYNIRLQTIQHHTSGVAFVIMAMHWMVDIFLVAFFFKFLVVPIQYQWEKIGNQRTTVILIFSISILLAVLITFFTVSCTWQDGLLWLSDNIIRVLDVGDTFQLFHITLHSLPQGGSYSILAILFRILVAIYLTYFGQKLWLAVVGGVGMTVSDLRENIECSTNPKIQIAAIRKLGEIGADSHVAFPTLIQALADRDSDVRITTVEALGKIISAVCHQAGYGSTMQLTVHCHEPSIIKIRTHVIPILSKMLTDYNNDVRIATAKVLGHIGRPASPAITNLVRAMADMFSDVRQEADIALEKINPNWHNTPAAQSAISDLILLAKNGNPFVAKSAKQVLDKIQ